jgi:CRISPR-associated protein Cas1
LSVMPGIITAVTTTTRSAVPIMSNQVGILYLDHAKIDTHGSCVVATTSDSTLSIPTATLTALFLGPGTSISHSAISIAAADAVTTVWRDADGVRAYSAITPLAVRADLFHQQVNVWSNRQQRLAAARRLYRMRFLDDADTSTLTMAELRAAEGRRVRDIYRTRADEYATTRIRRDTDRDR